MRTNTNVRARSIREVRVKYLPVSYRREYDNRSLIMEPISAGAVVISGSRLSSFIGYRICPHALQRIRM